MRFGDKLLVGFDFLEFIAREFDPYPVAHANQLCDAIAIGLANLKLDPLTLQGFGGKWGVSIATLASSGPAQVLIH